MSAHLLQINIPTRNRANFLHWLLESMMPFPPWVGVAVFDNASSIETAHAARAFPLTHYERELENTGPAVNQLKAARFDNGAKYIWVLGDDELFATNGWRHIQIALESDPAWVLLGITSKKLASGYSSAGIWARHAAGHDPECLLHPTAWSGNIFKSAVFDHAVAEQYAAAGSIFPHFHALLTGLAKHGGEVILSSDPTVLYRKSRPLPPDNEHPKNTDMHLAECVRQLNALFGLSLGDDDLSRILTRRSVLNPLQQWRYILDPRNWRKIINRLSYLIK